MPAVGQRCTDVVTSWVQREAIEPEPNERAALPEIKCLAIAVGIERQNALALDGTESKAQHHAGNGTEGLHQNLHFERGIEAKVTIAHYRHMKNACLCAIGAPVAPPLADVENEIGRGTRDAVAFDRLLGRYR